VSRVATRRRSPAALQAIPTGVPDAQPVHVGQLWALGQERLGRLLALRPDLAVPAPASLAELEERSLSLHSVYRALLDADVLVLQLAQVLTIIGEKHAALASVREMVGDVPEADVQRGLSWLDDRHLISRLPGPEICVHGGLLSMGGAGALGPPAAPLVEALSVTQLRSILTTVGRKSSATHKSALTREVLTLVTDQDGVRALVDGAPAQVKEYAHRAARGSLSIQLPWDSDRTGSASGAALAPMWLVDRGLAYKDTWLSAVMPGEVGLALRGGRPFPAPTYQRPQIAVRPVTVPAPYAAEARATAAVQAAERLIDAWGSKPAALLKNEGIGVREVRRLARALGIPEQETFRLIEIVAAADLIVADTRRGLAMPTSAGDEWLDLGAADRWWALALSWLGTPMYPSMAGAVDARNKTIPALGYPPDFESEAARERLGVLRAVLGLPEGSGASHEALGEAVVWDAPMCWDDGPGDPSVMVGWTMAEMELLGLVVDGAPTPLASALVGGDLRAVRRLLADPDAGAWQLVLQADLTAVVTGHIPSSVRAEIEVLADIEGRGSATLYRFSEGSVRRAFDAGRSSGEILAFLGEHAAKGVPQPLAYLVGDVERRHGQVRLGRAGCYVRFEDPALAAEVARGTRTSKLGLRQIAPTVLVCDQPNDAVLQALRTAGYLPVVESKDGSVVHTPLARHRADIRSAPGPASFRSRAAGWDQSGGESADRWRSQLSAGGTAAGSVSSDEQALVAALLQTAGGSPPASGAQRDRRQAGSGSGPAVEIPTVLRRPARGADGPAGSGAEVQRLAGLLDDPDWGLDEDDGDGGRDRPTEIVRTRDEVVALLNEAEEQEWLVRLSYTSAAGRSAELTVLILGISDSVVLAQVAPRWTDQKYVVDRISWVRALTEAEEEMVW